MKLRAVFEYEVNPLDYSVEYVSIVAQDTRKIREVLDRYANLHVNNIRVEKIHETSPSVTPVKPC